MPVTLRLAFRNLFEHRSKSLIIGILLAVGSLILVTGNAFIDASRQGIRSAFTENYTGDVFVSGISGEGDVSLFGVLSPGGLAVTPIIPDYERIKAMIDASGYTAISTGMATGFGLVSRGDDSAPMPVPGEEQVDNDPASRFLFMFGVDATNYWNVFDSMEITSGKVFTPGEKGLVINENHLAKISKWLKKTVVPGDKLVVQGFSSAGFKIREIPITGTYKPRGDGATPEQMAFVDIDTLRVMAGMTVGSDENIIIGAAQNSMLSVSDTDSLFGADIFEAAPANAKFDESKLKAALAETQQREKANTADTGAWQFIVVKTKHPTDAPKLIKELNTTFTNEGVKAVAGDWQKAAGPYGQSVDVIRIVFTVAIAILSIVAIIIITNTFVISVIERTGEIGTMRAIGAEKSFIRRLFASEAMVLSLVFSSIGATLATLVVILLRALRIQAGNTFLEVLFGGKYMSPFVTPLNFLTAILAMIAVGYIAHLYPVALALRIEPVRAMQQE
jgi:putative ABC transport system permease protein